MKLEELVGKRLTEEQFDEAAGKKDKCYYKVKARYDVWPSAYASGALVKCRKVGAANWGNKSKKEGMDEAKYKGYDYKRQKRKDGLSLIVPALRKSFSNMKDLKKYIDKHGKVEGVNEAGMELNKLKDAIKMFQKKIEKQGRVTNARDEEHLERLMKVYNDMGGRKIKENNESLNWLYEKCWKGYEKKGMKKMFGKMYPNCVKKEGVQTNTWLGENEIYWESNTGDYGGFTFEFFNEDLLEAEYQGRKVKLGKIMQGDVKKFKVYVKNPKGNVVKVNFGQGGDAKGGTMRIRKSNPKARANFRARHNCDNPGPRHKARYWSCRKW